MFIDQKIETTWFTISHNNIQWFVFKNTYPAKSARYKPTTHVLKGTGVKIANYR